MLPDTELSVFVAPHNNQLKLLDIQFPLSMNLAHNFSIRRDYEQIRFGSGIERG